MSCENYYSYIYKFYARKVKRVQSFSKRIHFTKVEKLADAGFFYSKKKNVRCFSCGIKLEDGLEAIAPLERHLITSPNCTFINEPTMQILTNKIRNDLANAALSELFKETIVHHS